MDTVAVVVATFGDESWRAKARAHALPSAEAEQPDQLVHIHGRTLAAARNAGVAETSTEWLCFLDADDELEPGYLDTLLTGSGDLRAPAVRYVQPCDIGGDAIPPIVTFVDRDIDTMNPCVIGTLVRRTMFDRAGRFWNEPAWEDWSLFRRCWLLSATIVHHPSAVYRANVNDHGRNSTVANPHQLHHDIIASHGQWERTLP